MNQTHAHQHIVGRAPPEGLITESRMAALGATSIFSGLSGHWLCSLAEQAREQRFHARSVVVHEGGESTTLYVILSGSVRIYASEGDREVTIGFRGAGDHFAEIALLDAGPHPVSVVTLTSTVLLALPRADVVAAIESCPGLAVNVMRELGGYTRGLVEGLKTFALKDVYGRLVATLYRLADERDGDLVISGQITQQVLADLVGASRAMVGRVMKDLVAGGYITRDSKALVIRRPLPERW